MLLREALRAALHVALPCWLLAGCGDHDRTPAAPSAILEESAPKGECRAVERHYSGETAMHRAECSDILYASSPPVFGDHYPAWAAYGSYDYPVPLGYLVHDLEHGGVVFFYDCPGGCPDEVAAAEDAILALPDDPRCSPAVRVQIVLAPAPGLGARWAASAWGYSLTAECFDPQVFADFYEEHHAQAPEDLCADGGRVGEGACQ